MQSACIYTHSKINKYGIVVVVYFLKAKPAMIVFFICSNFRSLKKILIYICENMKACVKAKILLFVGNMVI